MPSLRTKRPGAIALIMIVIISAFALAVMTATSLTASRSLSTVSTAISGEKTFDAAEAGLQDALYRLGTSPGAQTYPLPATNGVTTTVTVTIDPSDPLGKNRIVTSVSNGQNIQRGLQIKVTTNALASSFVYGAQAGTGGIDMKQSTINGNLYSNGQITGQTSPVINGNVFTSWSGSGASVNGVVVGSLGNPFEIHAHKICGSSIYGVAFYQTVSGAPCSPVKARANDLTCSEGANSAYCKDIDVTGGSDPTATTYPVTPAQITEYKNIADDTTVPVPLGGTLTINSDMDLKGKISGNLKIDKGTVTITGPVWVTGTIDIKATNQVTIRLPGTPNNTSSGVIISDGLMTAGNNATLMGSGTAPSSFLMAVSTLGPSGALAIDVANSSTSVIFFAPNGKIHIGNAQLNNATGDSIAMDPGSVINYDSNLVDFFIPGGPPQPPTASAWQEL